MARQKPIIFNIRNYRRNDEQEAWQFIHDSAQFVEKATIEEIQNILKNEEEPLPNPPELPQGRFSKASAVWTIGFKAFTLLTGSTPLKETSEQLSKKHLNTIELSNRWSKEIAKLIKQCLAPDPWDRPQTTELIKQSLDRKTVGSKIVGSKIVGSKVVDSKKTEETKTKTKKNKGNKIALIGGSIAAATIIILILVILNKKPETPQSPQITETPTETVLPSDTLPSDTLPSDTLAIDSLDYVPQDALPQDSIHKKTAPTNQDNRAKLNALLKAANSAFNKANYREAIEKYEEFLKTAGDNYPSAESIKERINESKSHLNNK